MRWEKTKHVPRDLFPGIRIELETVDKGVQSVTIRGAHCGVAGCVKIQIGESYASTLHVLVPAKPETVDRWFVRGTLRDVPVLEIFEDEYEARERFRRLNEDSDGTALEVAKGKVYVDEETGVAGDDPDAVADDEDTEVPF